MKLPETMTADELYEKERYHISEEAESFARCDTDGFVSQHCHSLNARLARSQATILENDGKSIFMGLYEGDRRVMAKEIDGPWGTQWMLHDSESRLINRRGKKYLPSGSKSRILRQLGLSEHREADTAWSALAGEGKGFSGLGSVYIKVYRKGDPWGQTAQRI